MKITQLIVLPVFFIVPLVVFANANALFNASTPVQSYQSATSASSSVPEKQAVIKPKQAPKNVPAPKSSFSVSSSALPPSSHTVPASPIPVPPTLPRSGKASELESQMSDLSQATLLYQQNTNQKILTLMQQNQSMHHQLARMRKAMLLLNQQVSQLTARSVNMAAKAASHSESAQVSVGHHFKDRLFTISPYLLLFAIPLWVIAWFLFKMRRQSLGGKDA